MIIDLPDKEIVNPSDSVWSEGSKTHLEEKEIRLESALFEGRGLENTLKEKEDKVCKEKDNLCENWKTFLKWYSCIRQPAY
jgi:hypothetical protein